MPRAALLSIHARVEGTEATTWEGPLPGPALGSAVQRLRRRGSRSRRLLARETARGHEAPGQRRGSRPPLGRAPEAFAQWAGIAPRQGIAAFEALRGSLTPARTPVGEAWILTRDEPAFRSAPAAEAPARLLPSGDSYFLLHGIDRELLVPAADRRRALWTPRVWPGAVLVEGEIVGTWRRSHDQVTIQSWRPLTGEERDVVEAEAVSLPLPGIAHVVVGWHD